SLESSIALAMGSVNINYFYVFTSLIPILVSNGIYIALIKPKGDYKSGIVTLIASQIGYILE
ncbi:hypothetical protein, partial [Proteus mirabilis]|uniref:hypothetical protein n=1 Tax=Proteus mirabilis TaxID=584 RepID=UPI001954B74E